MKLRISLPALLITILILSLFQLNSYAADDAAIQPPNALLGSQAAAVGGGGGSGDTVTPDMFSGTMSYSVFVEVPPGRNGMTPKLNLLYRSGNPNGYMGVGWELEPGAIVRSLKGGINYSGNDYTLRIAGANIDLVQTASTATYNEYHTKIEGSFSRIRSYINASGTPIYWEVTDKSGMKSTYGTTTATRQDDPANPNNIFKWCIDKVSDTDGNYVTFSYTKNQGQIYLDRVDYTGHTNPVLPTTNYIKFYWESRTDATDMYTTNFSVKTALRLKTIDVVAGTGSSGTRVHTYSLQYDANPVTGGNQYSASTGRSLLTAVTLYGSDAIVNASGSVTGGTALPKTTFRYQDSTPGFSSATNWGGSSALYCSEPGRHRSGDFNGDGKTDDYCISGNGTVYISLSTGSGFTAATPWGSTGISGAYADPTRWNVADFDGDGRSDTSYLHTDGTQYVLLSNGSNAFRTSKSWGGIYAASCSNADRHRTGDFDGDGKADDYCIANDGNAVVALSKGDKFDTAIPWGTAGIQGSGHDPARWNVADFDGDGRSDSAYLYTNANYLILLSTGKSFKQAQAWGGTSALYCSEAWRHRFGDFNGDGKTDDYCLAGDGGAYVELSTGSGFSTPALWGSVGISGSADPSRWSVSDINGDGRTDTAYLHTNGNYLVLLSNGNGFGAAEAWGGISALYCSEPPRHRMNDFSGDGKLDDSCLEATAIVYVAPTDNKTADLLTSITNGIGASTSVAYTSSTNFNNTSLPFPIQVVSSVITDDGNGNIATTNYSYSGGYFYIPEKDFRGFNYVKVTGPAGANGERTITETRFHQGNDLTGTNNASAATGYMKGKPYLTKVSDGVGTILSIASVSYILQASSSYYFTPASRSDTTIYVNGTANKTTKVLSTYDNYGNAVRVDNYGDIANNTDDTTTVTGYGYNTNSWLMSYPASTAAYYGIGTASMTARTDYYYDNATSCASTSTLQIPTLGKLTRTVNWLSGGVSPQTRIAYDAYGNRSCVQDANGNTSTTSYDMATYTFPLTATNAASQTIATSYYGVNGVPAASTGLYGQVKTVTGLNAETTTTVYDVFGRKKQETLFNASGIAVTWTATSYNSFGAGIGIQHIYTVNMAGLYSRSYFDGFGRAITEKSTGPDGKVIAKKTIYDKRGAVKQVSLPYFDGIDTPQYSTTTYDALGRVIQIDLPDGTNTKACYSGWVSATVDANGHKRKETKNAAGKLIRVDEYSGVFIAGSGSSGGSDSYCDTTTGIIYASTSYRYDTMGNLLSVTDALNNVTTMVYDTLGRKVRMHDPDMGNWNYQYDPNGNLKQQTDAKGQNTYSLYDAINRLVQKDYLTQKVLGMGDVRYTYDETNRTYGKGRLTSIVDATGSTGYNYYSTGKTGTTTHAINGIPYVTQPGYDSAGRLISMLYPDASIVRYSYNGPYLREASDSATGQRYVLYSGYNALGQASTATYLNGVVTSYAYSPTHHRLTGINTLKGASTYQSLGYNYDNVGNITLLTDPINGNQSYGYDILDRLTSASGPYATISYTYNQIGNMMSNSQLGAYTYPVSGANSIRPHAVTTAGPNSYLYDANGNMSSGAGRNFQYDVENRPISITTASGTVTLYYDGNGNRVKKVSGASTTIYVAGLYEVSNGVPEKYIYANGNRIVRKNASTGATYYYHSDHLGSSTVVTNASGSIVENTAYYPFGATRLDTGTINVNHKFTGQEYDAETGLYFYGARYYDPVLCRFISADTIVPNFMYPQTLNRYSYCNNNPVKYVDPSGHFVDLLWYIAIGIMQYLADSYNHQQDPARYPALNLSLGFSFDGSGVGMSINGMSYMPIGDWGMGAGQDNGNSGLSVGQVAETIDNVVTPASAFLAVFPPTSEFGVPIFLGTKIFSTILRWSEKGVVANQRGAMLAGKSTNDYVYRGVHAGHPELQNAKMGIVKPGDVNGKITPELHNEGGYEAFSPYTSWTHDLSVAERAANSYGPGGVVLRVPTGVPPPGASWEWIMSPNGFLESEVLLKGVRIDAEMLKVTK